MWATLGKKIAIEGATPLEDHVYLGCSQRPATVNEAQISAKRDLFQWITIARVSTEAGGVYEQADLAASASSSPARGNAAPTSHTSQGLLKHAAFRAA